jgi:hypothetical protein
MWEWWSRNQWKVNAYIWCTCMLTWGFLFSITLSGQALIMVIISGLIVAYAMWRDR